MFRILLLFCLLSAFGFTRENPFLPFGYKKETKSSKLVKEEFKFPKNTKKIKRVIFEYVNEDGSISLKSIFLNKDFNPENKIIISQGGTSLTIPNLISDDKVENDTKPSSETVLDSSYVAKHFVNVYDKDKDVKTTTKAKEETFKSSVDKKENKDKKDSKKVIEDKIENPKNDLDAHIKELEDSILIKKLTFYNEVNIDLYQDKFIIHSDDSIKKHFDLKRENKIVIDINKKLKHKTEVQKVNKDRYKDVIIGIHSSFYRVVVILDKLKSYKFKKTNSGYEVSFK